MPRVIIGSVLIDPTTMATTEQTVTNYEINILRSRRQTLIRQKVLSDAQFRIELDEIDALIIEANRLGIP